VVQGGPETPRFELGQIGLADPFHLRRLGLRDIPRRPKMAKGGAQVAGDQDPVFIALSYCHIGIIPVYSLLVIIWGYSTGTGAVLIVTTGRYRLQGTSRPMRRATACSRPPICWS